MEPVMSALQEERRTMSLVFSVGMTRESIKSLGLMETLQATDQVATKLHSWPTDFTIAGNLSELE